MRHFALFTEGCQHGVHDTFKSKPYQRRFGLICLTHLGRLSKPLGCLLPGSAHFFTAGPHISRSGPRGERGIHTRLSSHPFDCCTPFYETGVDHKRSGPEGFSTPKRRRTRVSRKNEPHKRYLFLFAPCQRQVRPHTVSHSASLSSDHH